MAKLQNYNGRYCEWEFEYTFLALLRKRGGNISLEIVFREIPGERSCIRTIWSSF